VTDTTDANPPAPPPGSFPPPAAEPPPEPEGHKRNRSEFFAAIILGIAAVLTAFAAYQSSLKDGEALTGYTDSIRTLNDANAFFSQGDVQSGKDNQLFVAYAEAVQTGNVDLADYLTTLMRPEMYDAVQWWLETEEAITPFDDLEDNPYVIGSYIEAHQLEDEASATFDDANEKGEEGDKFQLATIILAVCLFFGGIANIFKQRLAQRGLLVVAVGLLVAGSAVLAGALA